MAPTKPINDIIFLRKTGCLYTLLGVKQTDKLCTIARAYKMLCLKFHPDKTRDPADAAGFIALTVAKDVLADPETRQQYDAYLANGILVYGAEPDPDANASDADAEAAAQAQAQARAEAEARAHAEAMARARKARAAAVAREKAMAAARLWAEAQEMAAAAQAAEAEAAAAAAEAAAPPGFGPGDGSGSEVPLTPFEEACDLFAQMGFAFAGRVHCDEYATKNHGKPVRHDVADDLIATSLGAYAKLGSVGAGKVNLMKLAKAIYSNATVQVLAAHSVYATRGLLEVADRVMRHLGLQGFLDVYLYKLYGEDRNTVLVFVGGGAKELLDDMALLGSIVDSVHRSVDEVFRDNWSILQSRTDNNSRRYGGRR